MSRPPDIDALTPAELKSLALQLLEAAAEDQRTIAALRDELARLKGGPGRPDIKPNVKPDIKPSGMEKATEPKLEEPPGKDRRRGDVRAKLTINEERKLEVDAPLGSRFKGYASFLVQDLVIRPHVTDFLRACWRTPEGKSVITPLPLGVEGHFGPELRRLVLALYHQGQVTARRLVELLRGFGVLISKRQVVRLLIAGKQGFLDEARDVLRAGLSDAAWITVDDTGARHKGKNGYCTQIGNAHFTWFGTTFSKSRLNFLELLRAGHGDYVVNEEALAYMRARALAGPVIARLSEHPDRWFADRAAWSGHLDRLGVSALKVHPDPVLIATEGSLWGSVKSHGDHALRGVLRLLRHDADPQQSGRQPRERFDREFPRPSQEQARRRPLAARLARLRDAAGMAGLRRRDRRPRQRPQRQADRPGAAGAETTAAPQDHRLRGGPCRRHRLQRLHPAQSVLLGSLATDRPAVAGASAR